MRVSSLGEGEASGARREVSYLVRRLDPVMSKTTVGLFLGLQSFRPTGGRVGRPVTSNEAPANLRGVGARSAKVWIGYRADDPVDAPQQLLFLSPYLALGAPGAEEAATIEELSRRTADYLAAAVWPNGHVGAKIELRDGDTAVWTGFAVGRNMSSETYGGDALDRGFVPWAFVVDARLGPDNASPLLSALRNEKTLGIRITLPGERLVLQDALYSVGYPEAFVVAKEAFLDPDIARSISERCRPLLGRAVEVDMDLSPAREVCLIGDASVR
jgi:hypothetical protein